MNEKILEWANEKISTFEHASMGVIDEAGYPSVSAVSLQKPVGINEIFLTTTLDSNKAKRLMKNNKASIHCYTNMDNITLVGEVKIFAGESEKSKYWQSWVDQGCDIYPGGATDENYCFMKFTTKRVSLFIDGESAAFEV